IDMAYSEVENFARTGFKVYDYTNCTIAGRFSNYAIYHSALIQCPETPSLNCSFIPSPSGGYILPTSQMPPCPCKGMCGEVLDFIDYGFVYEAYGWSKIDEKTTKEFFYEGATVRTLETVENFTYNPENKQLATHSVTGSQGETLLTE